MNISIDILIVYTRNYKNEYVFSFDENKIHI